MERSRKDPAENFEPPGTKLGVGLYPSDRQESSGLGKQLEQQTEKRAPKK
jgi:hypothetical protein